MRSISIFTHPTHPERPAQPRRDDPDGCYLIEEGMKAGWLIATEGVDGNSASLRVSSKGGELR